MKPVRAAKADTGEIAAAAGCKPAPVGNNGPRALRQIPPFPCAVKGAEMHKKWAISGTRYFYHLQNLMIISLKEQLMT